MSGTHSCPDGETCPRVFETQDGDVVVQGYVVQDDDRPVIATPPEGELQVRMPRARLLEFTHQLEGREGPRMGHLLDGARRSVFRLEAQPGYEVDDPRWDDHRAGRPLPPRTPENSRWLRRVADSTAAGVRWSRVHVVRTMTAYQRFELDELGYNVAAGEEVRVAALGIRDDGAIGAVHEAAELREDFWLIDDGMPGAHALLLRYSPGGHFLGAWRADDPAALAECRRLRDVALGLSVPLDAYRADAIEGRATA